MNWYHPIKVANEIGHGNTLEGQFMKREKQRLTKEVDRLRLLAASGGPDNVLPRWKGDVRQKILLLPALDVIERMSMIETEYLAGQVDSIRSTMDRYSASRFKEIIGDADKSR